MTFKIEPWRLTDPFDKIIMKTVTGGRRYYLFSFDHTESITKFEWTRERDSAWKFNMIHIGQYKYLSDLIADPQCEVVDI